MRAKAISAMPSTSLVRRVGLLNLNATQALVGKLRVEVVNHPGSLVCLCEVPVELC